jgi:tetratricopeptide (TPR) repeat protein
MDSSQNTSSNLNHLALNAALDSNWDQAVEINQEILKVEPTSVDALNRLAHAYFEKGDFDNSKKFYTEVLTYDPYNPIAAKNLKILQCFKAGAQPPVPSNNGTHARISPSLFLQEPGKTKLVNLLKVAEPQRLSKTYCGMQVELVIKNRGISVTDSAGAYLGVLPDDMSHQILRLIKGGNKYMALIKSVKVNGLSILIRETFRSAKFRNQPSFIEFAHPSTTIDMLSSFDSRKDMDEVDPEVIEEES